MATIVKLPVTYRPHPQNPNESSPARDVAKWLREQSKMLRVIADTADRAADLLSRQPEG